MVDIDNGKDLVLHQTIKNKEKATIILNNTAPKLRVSFHPSTSSLHFHSNTCELEPCTGWNPVVFLNNGQPQSTICLFNMARKAVAMLNNAVETYKLFIVLILCEACLFFFLGGQVRIKQNWEKRSFTGNVVETSPNVLLVCITIRNSSSLIISIAEIRDT